MAVEDQALQSAGPAANSGASLASFVNFHNIKLIFGLAAALAVGIGIILWAIKPSYAPLFNHMSEHESAEIIDILRTEKIPFEIAGSSGLIMVPSNEIQMIKMKLAASGLSQRSSGGFELLQQEQALGTSQFVESARYQHILETELSRTISGMRNIDTARVHLALPKQSAFVRKNAKSSASVMVKLLPGRVLEQEQVSSIIHLVASSIPYLESSQVTVVDQWGRLLTTKDSSTEMALTSRQFEYTRKLEDTYRQRIESILTPIIGMGSIRAEVNAELDFSVNESTQEIFQPDETKIRSENIQESQSLGNTAALGIPGALSNQPPGGGIIDNNAQQDTQLGQSSDDAESRPINSNKNTVRNYELDKTISRTRSAQGEIKRLTVAVAVDNKTSLDQNGKASKVALTQDELDLVTSLVKEAVGFKEERGDSVVIINKPFQMITEEIEALPEPSILEQPWLWTLLKQALSAVVVLFIIFGIIRPALQSSKPGKGKKGVQEPSEDRVLLTQQQKMAEALPAPPHVYGDILNMARAMAADDPKRVAKVVKDWLSHDV